jgi:CheY-like chemotaxis protein
MKILVVEDNEMLRSMLVRRLARLGYDKSEAGAAGDALEAALRVKPDVIIMDMSLPDLDGWETTTRLKKDPATKGIPVIALTAHALPQDRQRGFDAGCDAYETKPIDLPRLLAKISALTGSPRN